MSKKAAAVAEAEPKFKQPWQGFLTFGTIIAIAYMILQWFIHPVWGLFSRFVRANAYISSQIMAGIVLVNGGTTAEAVEAGKVGLLLSLNNPNMMSAYPLGYMVDWVSFFVFGIVWWVAIAVLCRPFTPSKMKQPWLGLMVLILTVIFAFATYYILGVVMHWKGQEMIMLGTAGFLIFPIWATLFHYWPFVPKRAAMNPWVRGAIYTIISWFITFILYWIINTLIWGNAMGTVATQYIMGDQTLATWQPTQPYDRISTLLLCIIVGANIFGNAPVSFTAAMSQPKRGTINFILAIIFGIIVWLILSAILAPGYTTTLIDKNWGPFTGPWLLTLPTTNHNNVTAYIVWPLLILLAGQLTFANWPYTRWGNKGPWILVILAFVLGSILYFLLIRLWTWIPAGITGANLVPAMSGLSTMWTSEIGAWIENWALYHGFSPFLPLFPAGPLQTIFSLVLAHFQAAMTGAVHEGLVYMMYFEGLGTSLGGTIFVAWTFVVVILGVLMYEAFDHWPWK